MSRYLVAVLGEVPDQAVRRRAEDAGFRFDRRVGPALGSFTVFTAAFPRI